MIPVRALTLILVLASPPVLADLPRGRALEAVGDYRGALAAYAEADGTEPASAVAEARLLELLGEREAARDRLRSLTASVAATQDGVGGLVALGDAYRALAVTDPALYREALRRYEEAARLDPDDPVPLVALGDLLLDRYNNAEALQAYRNALELDGDYVPALFGIARSQQFDYSPAVAGTLDRCLELDPGFLPARRLQARLDIDSEHRAAAEQQLERVFQGNPVDPEALALLAALRFLDGDLAAYRTLMRIIDSETPGYVGRYRILAEVAAQNRRYRDAMGFALMAVREQPDAWWAHTLAGENRLRLGDMAGGRRDLETAFRGDPFDVRTRNTLELLDRLDDFETIQEGNFVLAADRGEAAVLAPRLLPIAEQAYAFFSERYGNRPRTPIRIEVYPRHEDFSVRTVGLVGVDIVGVSFGPVIALDSPSAKVFGAFNWASAVWHEIAHSFHLDLTDGRVPRWFTEGLSVYEERLARPGWGMDASPGFLQAFSDGRLVPASDLSRAFLRPTYPEQIPHAYFQTALIMEMVEERYGFDAILALLHGYADGRDTAELVEDILGLKPAAFDGAFDDYVNKRYSASLAALGTDVDDSSPRRAGLADVIAQAAEAEASGDLVAAAGLYRQAVELFPDHAGPGSAWRHLARVLEAGGETAAAIEALRRSNEIDADDLDGHRELARLLAESGDAAGETMALERTLLIDPFDAALHRRLAELYEADRDWHGAAASRRAVLALGPADPSGARYLLARSLYRAGRADEARDQVLDTLEHAPLYEDALELLLTLRARGEAAP